MEILFAIQHEVMFMPEEDLTTRKLGKLEGTNWGRKGGWGLTLIISLGEEGEGGN